METHNNRIMRFIETKLLTPSYVVMLLGLAVRSVALGLSAAIPYSVWPVWLQVGIELLAVVAMVGCADLILGTASSSAASLDRQIAAIVGDPKYQANPRLNKEKFEQQQAVLTSKREAAVAGLRAEKRKEFSAVVFCGSVTVSYGIMFAMTIIKDANPVAIATEIMGVASIPFITWYIAAVYKPHTASPEQTGKTMATDAFAGRLGAAKGRFETGEETTADVRLLKVAVAGSDYHVRMADALAVKEDGVRYLTVPQLYQEFELFTSSDQSWLRRFVRTCGDNGDHGIIWDAENEQWIVPEGAFATILRRLKTRARNPRTKPDMSRTNMLLQPAIFQESGGHRPDSVRTLADHA